MDKLLDALVNNAPGIAGIVVVVILFLRAQDSAMKQWTSILTTYIESQKELTNQWRDLFSAQREAMNMMVVSITSLEKIMISHDTWERAVIDDIQTDQQNVITAKLKAIKKAEKK